jgi:signal transduction histidine kinase
MFSFIDIFVIVIVCFGLFLIIHVLYSKNTKLLKMISERDVNFSTLKEEIEELREKSKNKEQELKFSEDKLRLLSSQLIFTQESERKRLARELHDGLGQSLIALKIY